MGPQWNIPPCSEKCMQLPTTLSWYPVQPRLETWQHLDTGTFIPLPVVTMAVLNEDSALSVHCPVPSKLK